MTAYAHKVETFVSSLHVLSSDDDFDGVSTALPVQTGLSSGPGWSAGSTKMGANGLKGRNSVAVVMPRSGARASKTNALAALSIAARQNNAETEAAAQVENIVAIPLDSNIAAAPSAKRNPALRSAMNGGTLVSLAPALDFSSLRMHTPRLPNPPPRPSDKPSRIFGLDHCPVYHPTVEEFTKPMEYIESIAKEAKEVGICKVVPPEGWRPSFALETETFRFKTRLQQLNSMEASARASLNFLEQLHIFHRQHGKGHGDKRAIIVPTIGGKPLDLWKLKREVTAHGGYDRVTSDRKWSRIAKKMGYNVVLNTAVCSQIKTAYLKIVTPFEDFVKRVKQEGGTPPPDPSILDDSSPRSKSSRPNTPRRGCTMINGKNDPTGSGSLATPQSLADLGDRHTDLSTNGRIHRASETLNKAINSDTRKVNGSNGGTGAGAKFGGGHLKSQAKLQSALESPGEACEICTMDHDPEKIVLCDGCDRGYHLQCMNPPIASVPESQFFCNACLLANGADYGFEEGEDHSLYSFRRRADAFKRKWLKAHPIPSRTPKEARSVDSSEEHQMLEEQVALEDHFEREFWRLVESQEETVEVEYGADVNSSTECGGLPNMEMHPNDPYSRDGWNLNNLPILAGSLLRYIKSDISGMTIPWIYVGMVFSTFAWHREDQDLFSINYHHWGDTKTWYGVPGEDGPKLEATMKLAAPELFEQQPDLMFQLVTLMSPGRLKKHGVRVVACDQRPNEFVITFPRAYHSGFNHGFNFNEAVNFALPDWLPTGLECVNQYREIRKNPVFSHDELLVTISIHEKSPRSSHWLLPAWEEMVQRELALREKIRSSETPPTELHIFTDIEEEEYQCTTCRMLCYLSQVVSEDGKVVVCPDHISDLSEGLRVFRLRFSDSDLLLMLGRVRSRAEKAKRVSMAEIPVGGVGSDPSAAPPSGYPPTPEQDGSRTTGRKRKPSALALEAAGEELEPASQKAKISHAVKENREGEGEDEDGSEEGDGEEDEAGSEDNDGDRVGDEGERLVGDEAEGLDRDERERLDGFKDEKVVVIPEVGEVEIATHGRQEPLTSDASLATMPDTSNENLVESTTSDSFQNIQSHPTHDDIQMQNVSQSDGRSHTLMPTSLLPAVSIVPEAQYHPESSVSTHVNPPPSIYVPETSAM